MPPVSLDEVRHAGRRCTGFVFRTPVVAYQETGLPQGNSLWLKAENLQRTGSFKIRGAYNAVASLDDADLNRGIITYSSGNHGQAVACAAGAAGARAIVVMPEDAIRLKVEATKRWGAEVVFAGRTSLDRQKRALALAEEHGYAVIPPFDDQRIIAGQGTVGLEILEQCPELEAVVVQVGGGGLVAGIATAVKSLRPDVAVIGVEPEGGADARDSLRIGHPVAWQTVDTVADGLRTSRVGDLNFAAMSELLDDIVTVTDNEILRAVALLAGEARLVAEPSGAVAAAAVFFGHAGVVGKRVVAVVSGGNIDPARLRECLALEPASASAVPSVI